ncbi:MAG: PKD domain-containing protein [Planctomycetota bacterium]
MRTTVATICIIRRESRRRFLVVVIAFGSWLGSSGCSQFRDVQIPEPIRSFTDPEFGRKYLLYRPSLYDRRHDWPLVVVCHGSFPDSPRDRVRAWANWAESRGIFILAPTLEGVGGSLGSGGEGQLAALRRDERHILSAVQHVRGGHSISDDRIFLDAWSDGAAPALYTGLLHPELFRAISVEKPKVPTSLMTEALTHVDEYQPIQVLYPSSDALTGKKGRDCADWLRINGLSVRTDSLLAAKSDDARAAADFFEEVLRRVPWLLIRSYVPTSDRPREYQFKLQSSFEPKAYHWEFGDGQDSPIAQPIHSFFAGGSFRVILSVTDPKGVSHRRATTLHVP